MNKRTSFTLAALTVFMCVCLQTVASGQTVSQGSSKLASIRAEGASVRWDPAISYSSVTLSVSAPDGNVFRREFPAGTTPSFALISQTGASLGDGHYTYELTFAPVNQSFKEALSMSPDETAAAAAAAAEQGRSGSSRAAGSQSVVQSGSFAVLNGVLYVGNQTETMGSPKGAAKTGLQTNAQAPGVTPLDQVIPDDLIVQGSACIGLDCVNNESFGFDTIRLKENNTRIKFDDTSTGAGFPANDWQLTANDSANGGANKFSIEDITTSTVPFTVTGGAATNSIFVDSTGRVGFRTATPVLDLHVATSNTPGIRLEQNNSGGFNAQTWDVAGNEANFFVRDVTGGSRLPFRIRPGAPTSSIDISATGNVGIGTASPASLLTISAAATSVTSIQSTGTVGATRSILQMINPASSGTGWDFGYNIDLSSQDFSIRELTAGAAASRFIVKKSTGRVGIGTSSPDQTLSVNGDASKLGGGSWQSFSDERLKDIKGNFNSGLKAVMQLQPLRYEYKRDNVLGLTSAGEHIGFGAQAVQKIIPEAVTSNASGYLMVNNDPIIWTMLNAIKEQQKEIVELKAQVQKLRAASHKRRR